ncbi:hypothetical protein C2845_PM13G06880 [Panicum miliaceum]|uniref:DUF7597 domain-containing protein n=1 Tax=Panicum miliaceum TaxID=4540 RepID=A0A3L6RHI0_PANMI|nr:hypothetical protein C2845_PM13G06880 [Panicum miliaceum]
MRVFSAFPSPLGLGLFQLENPVQRAALIDASPIPFGHGLLRVRKHDEALNLRSCVYTRDCWIMFLAFPLDYQTVDFIRAAVAPFGRLIQWFEGPNKSRVLTRCLVLTPARVPRSVIVSQGTMLGGNGRSWSVQVFILGGNFPDGFPGDEDPVPANGNPHPVHGEVQHGNPNAPLHWHHDFAGVGQAAHEEVGMNDEHVQQAMEDLQLPMDNAMEEVQGLPEWPPEVQMAENAPQEQQVPQHPDVPQDTISFDKSGSTAQYLRAHGPDITLNIDDIFRGTIQSSSSSSNDASSVHQEIQSQLPISFQIMEIRAFENLTKEIIRAPLIPVIPIERVDFGMMETIVADKSILSPKKCQAQHMDSDKNAMAIIIYKPSLHAIMIKVWAEAQGPIGHDQAEEDTDQHDSPARQDDLTSDCMTVSFPSAISVKNPFVPLEESSVKRSSRLNENKDGFQHYQLEDNPRKKQRVWAEVPIRKKDGPKLLDNPPKPTDGVVPAQIPVEILQEWGIDCSVAPGELTVEALSKGRSTQHN